MTPRTLLFAALASLLAYTPATADDDIPDCKDLPKWGELQRALSAAQDEANGGFGLDMWGTIVDRDGRVCQVAFTGEDRGDQWPGSRVISAQKANTANAFSLPGLALSTANLYAATQPGGSLFGLQFSNPVDTAVAYGGEGANHQNRKAEDYGQRDDPMKRHIVGGVNVFGGGLGLYNADGVLLGAIGVSGDTSCADHNIAWRTRDALGLDYVPAGVGDPVDNIIYDTIEDPDTGLEVSPSGFGHPICGIFDEQAMRGEREVNAEVIDACPPGDGATAGCTDG